MIRYSWLLIIFSLWSCFGSDDEYVTEQYKSTFEKTVQPPLSIDTIKIIIVNIDKMIQEDDNYVIKAESKFRKFAKYLSQGRTSTDDAFLAAQSAMRSCEAALSSLYGMRWPAGTPDTLRNKIMTIVDELNHAYGTQSLAYSEAMAFFETGNEQSYKAFMAGMDQSNHEKLLAIANWIALKMEYGVPVKKAKAANTFK